VGGPRKVAATLEERVAYLEGKVEEHSNAWRDLAERLDRVERRIDVLDQRLSSRMEALDQRLSSRIEALDQKFSRHFLWVIGIQVTILLSLLLTFLRP